MKVKVSTVLIDARARLSEPGAWTRGTGARDALGNSVGFESVGHWYPGATCWCLSAAISLAAYKHDDGPSDRYYRPVADHIRAWFPSAWDHLFSPMRVITAFNDLPGRTLGDVLAVLDGGIAIAKAEEARAR